MTTSLVYVSDEVPGIRRVRRGRGFAYQGPRGGRVSDADRERIDSLVIPPAWSEVWICPDDRGHLQATGRDAKGRKQYRYHPKWRQARDRDKFGRLVPFGEALPGLRREVEETLLASGPLTFERVVALVIALLDETLVRIGNTEYVENGSHGLTTLRSRHVEWGTGELTFRFPGKSGVEQAVDVEDPRLARLVRRCHQLGGQQLFTYRGSSGEPVPVTSSEINDVLRQMTGLDAISAKDFRTWGGTVVVTEHLARSAAPPDDDAVLLEAIDAAAEALGNSRAVCRASYVHPGVVEAAGSGRLQEIWADSRARTHLRRGEVALLSVLT